MAEQSNTPQLRFQGYTDAWGQERLGDIAQITMGQSPDGATYTDNPKDHILVQGNADMKDHRVCPRVWTTQVTKTAEPGDIILSVRAPVGEVGKTDYDVVLGRGVSGIRGNDFIYHSLIRMNEIGYWSSLSTGSTFDSINSNDISNAVIAVPSQSEQEKIGCFLTRIDDLLSLHRRKREKLQEIKKSLLQKMFPAEGEDRPQIRFAGYTDAWGQERLGDIADRFDNLRVPVEAAKRVPGPVPYYGANGIQDYVSGYTHDGEYILVAEDGASDLVNYPVQYVSGKIWVNNHAHVLQGKEKVASTKFLKYLITRADVGSLLVGGSRAKLNAETMMNMDVRLPEDYQEQVDIGSLLFGVDDLLSLHQRKLYKLQEIKKALLQKMFC